MSSSIIKLDRNNTGKALARASEIILSGGAVAYPTESFYGLGVNARDEKAVRRLFRIKKRREEHPILILIDAPGTLEGLAAKVPETARRLSERFWPGGLTLLFEAGPEISPLLTAGTGKIGIRLSGHPVATGLAGAAGVPITGTSANLAGDPSCLRAGEVFQSLGKEVDLILDGGETAGGKGSTVLDVTVDPPRILREGMVSREQLSTVVSL
jgi:L-threonylcarbamoyladenylate synthase